MSKSTTNAGSATAPSTPVPDDSPRRVRRDLRFVRWYAYTVGHVMTRYRDGADVGQEAQRPAELLARGEVEVAAECRRMRIMFRAIVAVVLMPMLLAGFLWSGLYWLPVTIPWFPFYRGSYGLPLFSLFEWLAFLMLAAFLAGSLAVMVDALASTRRVSTEYRRLSEASAEERAAIAVEARSGAYPRTAYLLGRAKPFAAYAPLMSSDAVGHQLDPEVSA